MSSFADRSQKRVSLYHGPDDAARGLAPGGRLPSDRVSGTTGVCRPTDRGGAIAVASGGSLPLVEEITPWPQPEEVLLRMAGRPYCLFLDTAMAHPTLGRYSFLAADPFEFVQVAADGSDALGAWIGVCVVLRRPALPACRRFRAGPRACSATTWDAVWSGCRRRNATSSACRPWRSDSTTWWWRWTTWPAGRGSSRKDSRKSSLRTAAAAPRNGWPRCASGLPERPRLRSRGGGLGASPPPPQWRGV